MELGAKGLVARDAGLHLEIGVGLHAARGARRGDAGREVKSGKGELHFVQVERTAGQR
jgi:hypothetical protein